MERVRGSFGAVIESSVKNRLSSRRGRSCRGLWDGADRFRQTSSTVHMTSSMWNTLIAGFGRVDANGATTPVATTPGVCEATAVPDWIRVSDCQLRKIVASGLERSETFRQVVERVGRLKGLVYIDCRYVVRPRTPRVLVGALMHTVTKAGPYRILHVMVGPHSGDRPLLVLAHELQHAVEVLESDATTEDEIDQLFERIGFHTLETELSETLAALDIERAVAKELSAAHKHERRGTVTPR